MAGEVEGLVLGQEERLVQGLVLDGAMHPERHARALLAVLIDLVVDAQVVAEIVLVQRMALHVQVSGFEHGHKQLSFEGMGSRADPGSAPQVSCYR
ncbi:hypothetical protein D3C84_967300 [compost metagenome]